MKDRALTYAASVLGAGLLARYIVRCATRYELRDRVVVITGGSRGLGLVLARELLARGAKLAICARDAAELDRARGELVARGGHVFARTCDITNRDDVERFTSSVRNALGPIDVLVNNAGVIEVGPMESMTREDYERAMATHFWGPLSLTNAVLPDMRARGHGRIVNITSIGGKIAVPHLLPYTASKFALVGLSEGMRIELAKDGICVTTVAPGLMRTGSPRNAMFKGQHRAEYTWFALGAALPLTSMSAERAARRIATAIVHGEPEVILSLQAKIAIKLDALLPGLVQRVLGIATRLLPAPGGIGTASTPGYASESRFAPSLLTRASDRAAQRNNEV